MRVDGDPLHTGKGLEGPSVHQHFLILCVFFVLYFGCAAEVFHFTVQRDEKPFKKVKWNTSA